MPSVGIGKAGNAYSSETMVATTLAALATMALIQFGGSPHTTTRLVTETSTFIPGKPFTAALVLVVEPMWYVYWTNPGDSGQSPSIKWTAPDGWTFGPLMHPAPHRHLTGGFASYIHDGKVVLPFEITPPKTAAKNAVLKADVSWLVCRDECLPGSSQLELRLQPGTATRPTGASKAIAQAVARIPSQGEAKLEWVGDVPQVRFQAPPQTASLEVFPLDAATLNHTEPLLKATEEDGEWVVQLRQSEYLSAKPRQIRFLAVPLDQNGRRIGPGTVVKAR